MSKTLSVLAGLLILGTAPAAWARGEGGDHGGAAWMQNADIPQAPGCAAMQWNVSRSGDAFSGMIWNKDGSGMASISGTADPSNKTFHLRLVPVMGASPPLGTVDGMLHGGEVTAKLSGPNCNATYKFTRGAHSAAPSQ
jgi:hypothetical protein